MTVAVIRSAAMILAIAVLAGCSGSGLKTFPVNGKVELKGGDAALLAGSTVELAHETDEAIRPYGNLDASGNFAVKTLHAGELVSGAPEGAYKARLVLADESDDGIPKRPPNLVHRRFLDFETSGLSLKVPGGDYTVSLSGK